MSVVSETVKRIVVDLLNGDDLYNPQLTFEELGMDSIDRIELIMFSEHEFGVNISGKEASKLTTPSKLIKFLEEER